MAGSGTVKLLMLTSVKYGGWVTDARCMVAHLRESGAQATALRPGRRKALNDWCQAMPPEDMLVSASLDNTVVLCAQMSAYGAEAIDLAARGFPFIIHDPTEYADQLLCALRRGGGPVIVHRETNRRSLERKGIRAALIPMPYVRQFAGLPPDRHRPVHAVAISRLDWDKHTEIIVEANKALPAPKRVRIYGAENSQYTFHKLRPVDTRWKASYYGRFESNPVHDAVMMADMSAIKGDGCGSQLTFLEAQDAGAVPVLNERWFEEDVPDPTAPTHALRVGTASELQSIMLNPPRDMDERRAKGYALLEGHLNLGKDYLQAFGWC